MSFYLPPPPFFEFMFTVSHGRRPLLFFGSLYWAIGLWWGALLGFKALNWEGYYRIDGWVLRQEGFERGKSQCLMDAIIICIVFFSTVDCRLWWCWQ